MLLYIKYFVFTCSERNYVIGRNDNNKLMSYKQMQVVNITTHSEGIKFFIRFPFMAIVLFIYEL